MFVEQDYFVESKDFDSLHGLSHLYVPTGTCVCIHTDIYTYTHTYTHTPHTHTTHTHHTHTHTPHTHTSAAHNRYFGYLLALYRYTEYFSNLNSNLSRVFCC